MSRAVIVSNGKAFDYSKYEGVFRSDDFIICADGGIHHLLKLGIYPDLWIGDFDSCKFDELIKMYPKLKEVNTLVLKKDKDETDTHFSCIKALEMGYNEILIVFASGGRLDHMLSNIHILEFILNKGAKASITDEKNTIHICSDFISVPKVRKYLSVIPLDKEVTIEKSNGLLYPLNDFTLRREISMGVSNEIIDDKAEIYIKSGKTLIVESDD